MPNTPKHFGPNCDNPIRYDRLVVWPSSPRDFQKRCARYEVCLRTNGMHLGEITWLLIYEAWCYESKGPTTLPVSDLRDIVDAIVKITEMHNA